MRLIDIITAPWALLPEQLQEIQAIYATHLRGEKIDIQAIEARLGRSLSNEQRTYTVEQGGVGLLELSGVMAPKANLLMQVSGGVSTQLAAQQVRSMRADPRVRSAVLAIDSPGGSVFGTPALAEEVRLLAAEKPTVSLSRGVMASAAYWVGSAANAVLIEGVTDQVGSIGVVQRVTFDTAPTPGVIEMTRGRYKRIGSNGAPPTPDQMAYLDGQLDHMYSVFVEAVASHRGASVEDVLDRMADGRVFVGSQALDAGLVDGVSTIDALIEQLAVDPSAFAKRRRARPASSAKPTAQAVASADLGDVAGAGDAQCDATTINPEAERTTPMALDRKTLEAEHPDLVALLRSESAAAERQRIQDVLAQGMPGHDSLIQGLAFDGKTTGAEAAMAVLKAHKAQLAAAAQAHANDAPEPAPVSNLPDTEKAKTRAEQAAEAAALARDKGIDIVSAFKQLGYA